jgi:hypothetical protein
MVFVGVATLLGLGWLCWRREEHRGRYYWEYRRSCQHQDRLTGEEFYQGTGIPAAEVTAFRPFHATSPAQVAGDVVLHGCEGGCQLDEPGDGNTLLAVGPLQCQPPLR